MLEEQLDIEYSSTYWLHNLTVVPTTTQRTTSTTTQKVHKSIFSTSMSSNTIEKITERMSVDGDDDDKDDDDDDDAEKNTTGGASSTTAARCFSLVFVVCVGRSLLARFFY